MFSSLPLDVLPLIIDGLTKRSHIATACLVSRPFYDVAVILLYRVISVYAWHKDGKSKTIQLFTVLAENASLARYVRVLELRDFPKAQIGQYSKHEALLRLTVAGLRNCSFLRSCTWTRDGTLDSSILEALANLSGLRSLEINGHDSGNYDASILLRFPHLDKLSFIMPSARIAHQLPLWTQSHSGQLRHLTLICKSSSVVSDQLLISLAPNLASLESLYLTGCVKVTEDSVLTLLSFNHAGIRNLGLEGVSTQFTYVQKLATSAGYGAVPSRSATRTGRAQITHPWILHLQNLLKPVHTLCFLQIYASTPDIDPESIDGLLKDLALTHGPTLLRFSVHRIVMKPDTIQHIVSSCPLLEELFVVLQPRFLVRRLSHQKSRQMPINVEYNWRLPLSRTEFANSAYQ
ncbi:hypothetical protein DL96DRAFT_1814408 [Flagelloscypha sp. PMI_526]|nr:hypothetical protein DL96DRAFT_1814408 [Flagelloscypha sp. PMI_526]